MSSDQNEPTDVEKTPVQHLCDFSGVKAVSKQLLDVWTSSPHSGRLFGVATFVFSFMVVLFAVLLGIDSSSLTVERNLEFHGDLIDKMLLVAELYVLEEAGTLTYENQRSSAAWTELGTRREATDNAIASVREFVWKHHEMIDVDHKTVSDPSVESEMAQQELFAFRKLILDGLVEVSSFDITDFYGKIAQTLVSHSIKMAVELNRNRNTVVQLQQLAISKMQSHYLEMEYYGNAILGSAYAGLAPAKRAEYVTSFMYNVVSVNFLKKSVLKPLTLKDHYLELETEIEAVALEYGSIEGLYQYLKTHSSVDTTFKMPHAAGYVNNTAVIENKAKTVFGFVKEADNVSFRGSRALIKSSTLLSFCCVAIIAMAVVFGYYRYTNATAERIQRRNQRYMHDALVRVRQFAESFATLKLDPGPAPKSLQGTHLGLLEVRLQNALASMRAIIPSMPPLMFADYLKVVAKRRREQRGVDRDTRWSQAIDTRVEKTPVELLNSNSPIGIKWIEDMENRLAPHCESMYASFVTVDLSDLHRLKTAEEINLAEMAFTKIIRVIESTIFEFGGVMHQVFLDRAVGVWNIDTTVERHQEQAAICALTLSTRLQGYRRMNKSLKDIFEIRIGLTAGEVTTAVLGSEDSRTFQVFGHAIDNGIVVARVNQHHMSTVACDSQIEKEISFPCKPIELIHASRERVYEIINEGSSRKEMDLESRLSVYKRAFDLYEKRYYREALRVFRGYTKQYGYDCSVERLQSIITGV